MKKLTFLLIVLLSGLFYAQEFKLTPENFKDVANPEKNYVVIEVPNKTKHDLYIATKKFVNNYYKNPKFVTTDIEDEQIMINAVGSEFKVIYQLSGANLWRMRYQYEIQFKDRKIMFKPTFVELENTMESTTLSLVGGGMFSKGMFNKKGEVSKEKGNLAVENDVNSFVKELKEAVLKPVNSDW